MNINRPFIHSSPHFKKTNMEWSRGHFLGRGSSAAAVFTANSTSGDTFAVKSMELSQSESLRKEQSFLSILSSPHVVSYKGCNITTENSKLMYNLLMEYMPGGSLADEGGRLNNTEISCYTRQILQGLDYLHSLGIVHCDIKGSNVLVGETGAKIVDLGCAKWANQTAPIRGTPMFMAPEVARGQQQGFPADIWALGCTVIEMATGGSPWLNVNDPLSVLYRIAFSGELPEIPDKFSDEAKDFVSRCLIRDPKERWTAKQLLKHPYLEDFFNGHSKQVHNQESDTVSPTSILDQDVWNSMEDSTSMGRNFSGSTYSWTSHRQRIKQLADKSEIPSWKFKDEINWMTVRINGDGEEKATGGVFSDDEMEVDFPPSGGEKDDFSMATKISCWCKRCSNCRSDNSNLCEYKSSELFTIYY